MTDRNALQESQDAWNGAVTAQLAPRAFLDANLVYTMLGLLVGDMTTIILDGDGEDQMCFQVFRANVPHRVRCRFLDGAGQYSRHSGKDVEFFLDVVEPLFRGEPAKQALPVAALALLADVIAFLQEDRRRYHEDAEKKAVSVPQKRPSAQPAERNAPAAGKSRHVKDLPAFFGNPDEEIAKVVHSNGGEMIAIFDCGKQGGSLGVRVKPKGDTMVLTSMGWRGNPPEDLCAPAKTYTTIAQLRAARESMAKEPVSEPKNDGERFALALARALWSSPKPPHKKVRKADSTPATPAAPSERLGSVGEALATAVANTKPVADAEASGAPATGAPTSVVDPSATTAGEKAPAMQLAAAA